MAVCIYGGSLEFLAITMLAAPFAPIQTFLVALMVQARHLFYGIPLLSRYEGLGWKKPLLEFWLSDETFAVNVSAKVPEGIDRGWFYLWVSGLDWFYWVSGTATGAVFGALVQFDTTGLEFVMTAMFVVIFLEQWLSERSHWTALVGFAASVGCLLVFGREYFLVPTLCMMLVALTALRRPLEPGLAAGREK
jgi:4-azaleucine resistance transporter AzlC